MLDAINEFLGNSVLNCIYGGALAFGLAYALLLLAFQGISDVAGGLTDMLDIFGGGADVDIGGADADAGDGAGVSLLAIAGFISAFGAFGLAGVGFGAGSGGSLIVAVLGGFIFGGLGQVFFVYVLSPTTSAIVSQSKLTGMIAEVTTPIPAEGIGQISLVVQGSRITYSARSENKTELKRGTEVRIERIIGSVASVLPTSEFEP
jgi:membrane protein implicated in regulation of membrane protease activity